MDLPEPSNIAKDFAAAMHLALVVADVQGEIRFANPAFCDMFGYKAEQLVGQPITLIIPERMRGAHTAGMTNVAAGAKPGLSGKSVEVSALKRDGTEFPIEITLSTWKDHAGDFWAGATIRDISERRERDARLLRLASHDTLTGLQNRHEFKRRLAERLASDASLSLVLLDLDGLKDVNDAHGHVVGDSLLQAVGVRLSYLLGDKAMIGRLDGDEFAILLSDATEPAEARRQTASILHAFVKPFSLGGLDLELGASLGVAIAPRHGTEAEELLASADFALYRAKADGGRSFRLFDQSMRRESQARREMRDELRLAMRTGELQLHYQPQVDLKTRRLIGFEALIRWNHPDRGLLLPGLFLPALEQSALSTEIGWWTLEEACRMIALINADGGAYKVAVNLFATQFRAPNLRDRVTAAVKRHGIAPECLELEVTEQVALGNNEASLKTLTAMRDIGVGVAFDDFGTGYASLTSLQRYPLTTLKIDRTFIRDIQTRPSDAAITRALVAMSQEMGLCTVAEGIETEAQAAVLLDMGCRQAQGYFFGRPMAEKDAIAFLQSAARQAPDLRATGT